MEMRTVELNNGEMVEYGIRKSRRAKRAGLTLYPDGRLVATIPQFRTHKTAIRLINEKKNWIEKHVLKAKKAGREMLPRPKGAAELVYREEARRLITERVHLYNLHYNFSYNKISIKKHTAQWGSCSSKKNLNFNFKLIYLPLHLIDYVVVHELSHLKEMNHGEKFWNVVAETIPDYKKRVTELQKYVM